jgi:preprotein translocase subunit SecF
LKDLSLALFIGLATGTYSSLCIATPILAALREREPAMKALAKRVGNRADKPVVSSVGIVDPKIQRGPRNQPKRDRRR